MAFWNGIHLSAACRYQARGKLEIMHFRRILLMILCWPKTWEDYDKAALSSAGYTYVPDNTYTQKHFIEPSNQTTRSHKEYDVRYYYSAADFETGQTVTAIGIQDGQTLKSAPGITENLMKNKLDRDEAIKQGGTPGVGAQIFSVVSSLLLILGGFLLIILWEINL